MKVKFANGVVKECTAPTEQKAYRAGTEAGWFLLLKLKGEMTSTELDNLLTAENYASLEFLTTTKSGEDKTLFTIGGYDNITSSTIRYAENTADTQSEIQLTKGF